MLHYNFHYQSVNFTVSDVHKIVMNICKNKWTSYSCIYNNKGNVTVSKYYLTKYNVSTVLA